MQVEYPGVARSWQTLQDWLISGDYTVRVSKNANPRMVSRNFTGWQPANDIPVGPAFIEHRVLLLSVGKIALQLLHKLIFIHTRIGRDENGELTFVRHPIPHK